MWSEMGQRSTTQQYPPQAPNFYPDEWSQSNTRGPPVNMPRVNRSPPGSANQQYYNYMEPYNRGYDRPRQRDDSEVLIKSMFGREAYEDSKSASERELSDELQRLATKLQNHLERPTSPFPKRGHLINYVDSLIAFYIRDKEDVELLRKLIAKDDEYVMSAIDLFASDKDQENLLDTLIRIIKKHKQNK